MTAADYTLADVQARLAELPHTTPEAVLRARRYDTFFRRAFLSAAATSPAYVGLLSTPQELGAVSTLLQHRTARQLDSYPYRSTKFNMGIELPSLKRAMSVLSIYSAGLRMARPSSLTSRRESSYINFTLTQAAHATALAYRDQALHEIYSLTTGEYDTSLKLLMRGQSFQRLRLIYGVQIDATDSNLEQWYQSLLTEIYRMMDSMNELRHALANKQRALELSELAGHL